MAALRRLYRLRAARRTRERTAPRPRSAAALLVAVVAGAAVAVLATLGASVGGIRTAMSVHAALTEDLPPARAIDEHASFKTARVYDRHGAPLWEFHAPEAGWRTPRPLSQISQHLLDATLAAEDAFFYAHEGWDTRATLRSAFITLSGEARTGASTITQQLVRNVLMDPDEARQVTLSRKAREIILATRLETYLTKDEILERYLNEVYYGNLAYGAEAAALGYFGKHARDLSLPEAALLAGLVQSPSALDPTRTGVLRTPEGISVAAKDRQRYVLEQMAYHGFISRDEAQRAYAEPLVLKQREVPRNAPHWVEYVRDYVERQFGADVLYRGGLHIYTTLDLAYHERMQAILHEARPAIAAWQGTNAALIAVNPKTGEILAFNGSMDFHDLAIDGEVNVLTSERQPGSSIKPVVYAAAFERGWSPGTFVDDAPTCWPDWSGPWCPVNFDNAFHGPMTVRSALGNSLNIPAVTTLEFVGVDAAVDLGQRMGITSWGAGSDKTLGLSLTLGGAEVRPIDLAQAYATFANNGRQVPLFGITRIVDSTGTVVEEHVPTPGVQVLDPRAAYLVTNVLADPAAKLFTYGRNTPLVLSRPAASKTGTTDNFRDTWTAGYTPNLAIVVWVGNADGRPMQRVLSSMTAGRIWPAAMEASFEILGLPVESFQRPPGLQEHEVCGDTAMRPGEPPCRVDLRMAGS